MKLKLAITAALSLSLLFSCGDGDEVPTGSDPTEITDSAQLTQDLTASCTGDYHPVAWCTGAVAKVKCQHDFNPNISNGYRSVNCGAVDKLCRDYGSTANCVRP